MNMDLLKGAPPPALYSRFRARGALLATILCTAVSAVLVRVLTPHYGPMTQSFVRYLAAFLFLLPFAWPLYRQDFGKLRAQWRGILLVAVLNFAVQTTWTASLYHATATTVTMLFNLQIPFVLLFSFIAFHEERSVIRDPLFLLGTVAGAAGVLGLLVQDQDSLLPEFNTGSLLAIVGSLIGALYAVTGKHMVRNIHPVAMFAVVAGIDTVLFLIAALVFEDTLRLRLAGLRMGLYMALTGVVGVAFGHTTYHYAQKFLGAAFCNVLLLLAPLLTHLIAVFCWSDETLNAVQWGGALCLLGGTGLVLRAQYQARLNSREV